MGVNRSDDHGGQVIMWEKEDVIMREKAEFSVHPRCLELCLNTHTHKGGTMEGNTVNQTINHDHLGVIRF